jgi:hypothetical protein
VKPGHRLYEAWDEAFQNEVQGFIPEELRARQRCVQESWMVGRPSVLFFSLKRVKYNKTLEKVVKCNDHFPFDKVIYADMFLHKN